MVYWIEYVRIKEDPRTGTTDYAHSMRERGANTLPLTRMQAINVLKGDQWDMAEIYPSSTAKTKTELLGFGGGIPFKIRSGKIEKISATGYTKKKKTVPAPIGL